MTQQAIPGQAPRDPAATVSTEANGQSPQDGGQQPQVVAPAPETEDGRTVPLKVFTQSAQARAAIAERLGLSKDAPGEDFLARIDDLMSRQTTTTAKHTEDDDLDPAIVARTKALDEREWGVARREFGDEIVDAAQSFSDAMRTNRSPHAQASAFAAAVYAVAATMNGASPAGAGGAQPTGQQHGEPVETPDLGDLPQGVTPSGEPDPRDYKGDTPGFMRALSERAGHLIRG